MLNLIAFDANTARFKIAFCKRRKGSTNDFDEMQIIFDKTGSPAFDSTRAVKKSFSFNTGGILMKAICYLIIKGNPNGWSGLFMTELDFTKVHQIAYGNQAQTTAQNLSKQFGRK